MAERNAYLDQRDQALGERNEILRQRDELLGERNEHLRQRDLALGELNEVLRQRDLALAQCDRLLAQLDESSTLAREDGARPAGDASRRGEDAAPRPMSLSRQNTIIFVSLPKSGTEFISGGIRDATDLVSPWQLNDKDLMNAYLSGYCNRDDIYSTGVFFAERLLAKGLRELMPHGRVLASHAAATYHNLQALRSAGVRRLTALVRDPRDSTVSWTHHVRHLGRPMRNFHSFIQHLPLDYFDWPHARQLTFQVRTFLPAAVNWIESWLGAVAESDAGLEIRIVYFDELRRDPRRLFERLFEFHGVADYNLSRIRQPVFGERHYRQGEHDSWRSEFSEADRAFADNLIGDRLQAAFDRAAARDGELGAATAAENAGDDLAAARHLLSLLRRFGGYRPAWRSLERAAARRGIVIEPGIETANPFVIPESTLQAIEARLNDPARPDGIGAPVRP